MAGNLIYLTFYEWRGCQKFLQGQKSRTIKGFPTRFTNEKSPTIVTRTPSLHTDGDLNKSVSRSEKWVEQGLI